MASKIKTFVGNAPAKSQVWAFSPPVTANAKVWTLTLNGKSLAYESTGTVGDAVAGMLKLWRLSQFPEFKEITPSVPLGTNPAANPQGDGTNEILALYISGAPTGGSFQVAWGGGVTPFLVDPTAAPSGADSTAAGNPNGVYRYTYTFLNVNPLGQIGETAASADSATVAVTNHSINVTVGVGPLGTIGRRIYRTAAGGAPGTEKLLATIWDNTTTVYLDNIADGSLGASQPTANSTGIPYNATATQLQGVLQSLPAIGLGNLIVTGSGTAADPWLAQFANGSGAIKQAEILAGSAAFTFVPTIPAGPAVKLVVTEIQQGIKPNASPANDGSQLLLVSRAGVPFYLTSKVTGTIPAALAVNNVTQAVPPSNEKITIAAVPPTIRVDRTTAGKVGVNELQQISLSPNALSGSTFTLTFGANTTGNIPTPPAKPTSANGGTGVLGGANGAVYYWVQTFFTAKGETEPSAPSAALSLTNQQATLTISNGPSGVIGKRIYRTLAPAGANVASPIGPYYLVATINDNTTTSYTDNSADATIKLSPQPPTTNGALEGELEALASVGAGNVQISGANSAAFLGMTIQQGFAAVPPALASANSRTTPPSNVALASGSGGSLASGTYYYVLTSVDASGETLGSVEQSVGVIGPTGRIALTWTAGVGAAGYRIYRGTAAGGENVLVGTAAVSATSFIDYGKSPSALVYTVEFIGALANASQALLTASLANITVLPMIEIAETQIGYPIENEIQEVGWKQAIGVNVTSGTYAIKFPGLNVTAGPIDANAQAGAVLIAINAALPGAHFGDIAVQLMPGSVTPKSNLFALIYQGGLALTPQPQATIDLSGVVAGNGDTLTAVQTRLQAGSAVGRNEIATVTIDNSPTGGTFGLTGTLADGNTINASGVAYNASAATLQAAFPAGTVSVSGSAGGPYTIEAEGEAGAQKVIWQAVSSLTGASSVPGSPPGSNTTGIAAPVLQALSQESTAAAISSGTYYYVVTAINSAGETTASNELSIAIPADHSIRVGWASVTGATGYKLYRGTTPGGENVLIGETGTGIFQNFIDSGETSTSASPPVSDTSGGASPPTFTIIGSGGFGGLSAGTYYYKATCITASGETLPSAEINVTVPAGAGVQFFIDGSSFAGLAGYKIYRGTSPNSENILLATLQTGDVSIKFIDVGTSSSASPPVSNTTALSPPVQSNTVPSASGGSLATNTYYYELTAINSAGETTASNEKTAAVTGSTGSVALSWAVVTGASGYKIYRGLSASGENVLVAIITSGATTTFTDTGSAPAIFRAVEIGIGAAAVSEVQTITVTAAGGGFYAAEFAGQESGQVPWNAAAATLQTILQAIPTVGAGNLTVGLAATNGQSVYTVTFAGALAAHPQPLLIVSDIPVTIPPSVSNGFAAPVIGITVETTGLLALGNYYYVVTAITSGGETIRSNEVSMVSTGPLTSASATLLTWTPNPGDLSYNIYRGTGSGAETFLLKNIPASGTVIQFQDLGLDPYQSTLQGGSIYSVSLSAGATDNFTLTFGANATSAIAYNATAATVQTDLQALASIGASNATVTGAAGGPWTVSLAASVAGTGTLSGTMISLVSSGSPNLIYTVDVFGATSGSFTLSYGGAATIQYNASAATIKTALEGTSIGVGNVTVTGNAGGPWTITITPKPQNAGLALSGDGTALIGTIASLAVYPLTYCLATGPNFYDAPANWSDGALPSAYLAVPPAVAQVVLTQTDATLVAGTHGSLTPLTTYYYKITATNANGETTGGAEGSGTPFAGAKFYLNGTATAGTFDLTYGGQTAAANAFNATAATLQTALRGLSSIGSGNCTVTGTGTAVDPFVFTLAGSLLGTAPLPLSANAASLTGATISVRNTDTRSLAVWWNELPLATGYKVYRGTSAGTENVLVATISGQDTTVFVDDGTYTTTAASPATDANAWHTAVGDDEHFTGSTISCWYGIAADITNGYSIHGGYRGAARPSLNSFTEDLSYTGRIGLPAVNPLGYQEYRPLALTIGGPPSGAFNMAIGDGTGNGSPFTNLDTGTSQISMTVNGMGAATGSAPGLLWIGTNAASEIDLFKGSMGLGIYPGQIWQLGTLRQAYRTTPNTDTTLIVGAGGATIPMFLKNGGQTLLSTNVTTLTGKGGAITQDKGAPATMTLENCVYTSKSVDAMGALSVSAGGKFDRSQDSRPLSIGSVSLYAGATYLDPHGATVTTGQSWLDYSLVQCGYEDVTIDLGRNITGRRTQN